MNKETDSYFILSLFNLKTYFLLEWFHYYNSCNYHLAECYCEHEFGGPGKNGIMCRNGDHFAKHSSCGWNEWCIGPANAEEATDEKLCETGTCSYFPDFRITYNRFLLV